MNCLFLRRCYPDLTVDVTVTGTGNTSYCYANIGGTKVTAAGAYTVSAGDTITFGVYGSRKSNGIVKIDGTRVLIASSSATETYDWAVPGGISSITIAMTYTSSSTRRNGQIVVTTA